MKRGTLEAEYVDMKTRDNPVVMVTEDIYENMADDATGKHARNFEGSGIFGCNLKLNGGKSEFMILSSKVMPNNIPESFIYSC